MFQPFAISDNRRSRVKFLCFCLWKEKAAIVMLIVCLLPIACGCSKEKLKEMANTVNDKVKEQAKNISESAVVAEVIPATGRAEIKVSPPAESKAAYARLYVIGDGRPGVVQFTSYDPDKGPNTYPALLIRANTTATSLDSLGGQTLNAQVFFQPQNGAAILSTGESGVVPITIAPIDPGKKTLNATMAAGSLIDPTGKSTAVDGITIEGLMP